jgi:hypothetical protein
MSTTNFQHLTVSRGRRVRNRLEVKKTETKKKLVLMI